MEEGADDELIEIMQVGARNSADLLDMATACRVAATALSAEASLLGSPWKNKPSWTDFEFYIEADGCLTALDLIAAEAALLCRSVNDHLFALADILEHGKSVLAPATLARTILESGLRLGQMLDHRATSVDRLQRALNHRVARLSSTLRLAADDAHRASIAVSLAELSTVAEEETLTLVRKTPPQYGAAVTVTELAEKFDPGGLASFSWRIGSSVAHAELTSFSVTALSEIGWSHAPSEWICGHTFGAPLGFGAAAAAVANYVEDAPRSWEAVQAIVRVWARFKQRSDA